MGCERDIVCSGDRNSDIADLADFSDGDSEVVTARLRTHRNRMINRPTKW